MFYKHRLILIILISLFCTISFAFGSEISTPEDYYYQAIDFELSAKTPDDFRKLILIYQKVIDADPNYPNRELLASSLYAIADIYMKKLNNKEQAEILLKSLISKFPYTSWKIEAEKNLEKVSLANEIPEENNSYEPQSELVNETPDSSDQSEKKIIVKEKQTEINSDPSVKSTDEALQLIESCLLKTKSVTKNEFMDSYTLKMTLESKGKNCSYIINITPERKLVSLNGILYQEKNNQLTLYFPKENKIFTMNTDFGLQKPKELVALCYNIYSINKLISDLGRIHNSELTSNIYRINSQEDFFSIIDIFPRKNEIFFGQLAVHNELFKFFHLSLFMKSNDDPSAHLNFDEIHINSEFNNKRWKIPETVDIADSLPEHYDIPSFFLIR